jgi:uncharacterized protein
VAVPVDVYRWSSRRDFVDRRDELARLERWWRSNEREPINLYGRRRVGKSWLFRRFADGKRAIVLVADRLAPGQQLNSMAQELEPILGVAPQIPDVASLVRVLYGIGRSQKVLAVIDELPYLLGTTSTEQQTNLAAIQAVMERERDDSKLKLIVAGSSIGQMEALQAERSPMHGRMIPLPLRPLPFAAARELMRTTDPVDALLRYAVAGGMPRYLAHLGRERDLMSAIGTSIVDPFGPLYDEPRTVLQTELREPAVYFSVLAALAAVPLSSADIAARSRIEHKQLGPYLATLERLQLVTRHLPVGSAADARTIQWRSADNFMRFWFRFVQPYQSALEAGGDPRGHVDLVIRPAIADHASPAFEQVFAQWMRRETSGHASVVGGWWGPALHRLRAAKTRFTEEIDAVALHERHVIAVGEAKWTNRPMDASVLTDLTTYKLPALAQAGFSVDRASIVLASRSGFTTGLARLAAEHGNVRLLPADVVVEEAG